MWKEFLLYNPIVWILVIILGGAFLSWLYWYCKTTFKLEGSWKGLDKSITWRSKQMVDVLASVGLTILFLVVLAMVTIWVGDNLK